MSIELENRDQATQQLNSGFFHRIKKHFGHSRIYLIIIVLLLAWLFQVNRSKAILDDKMKLNEQKFITKQEQLLRVSGEEYLGLMMKTFSWAIREKLLKEDYEEINLYIGQLIKEKNVNEILVIDMEGLVVAASNRKQEEQLFGKFYDENMLAAKDVSINYMDGQTLHMISPIMAFNNQIGRLFIVYQGITTSSIP